MPNEMSTKPLLDYAGSIDQLEKLTGIDFFPKILNGQEEALEAALDKEAWPVNQNRYEKRLREWNRK